MYVDLVSSPYISRPLTFPCIPDRCGALTANVSTLHAVRSRFVSTLTTPVSSASPAWPSPPRMLPLLHHKHSFFPPSLLLTLPTLSTTTSLPIHCRHQGDPSERYEITSTFAHVYKPRLPLVEVQGSMLPIVYPNSTCACCMPRFQTASPTRAGVMSVL